MKTRRTMRYKREKAFAVREKMMWRMDFCTKWNVLMSISRVRKENQMKGAYSLFNTCIQSVGTPVIARGE